MLLLWDQNKLSVRKGTDSRIPIHKREKSKKIVAMFLKAALNLHCYSNLPTHCTLGHFAYSLPDDDDLFEAKLLFETSSWA